MRVKDLPKGSFKIPDATVQNGNVYRLYYVPLPVPDPDRTCSIGLMFNDNFCIVRAVCYILRFNKTLFYGVTKKNRQRVYRHPPIQMSACNGCLQELLFRGNIYV